MVVLVASDKPELSAEALTKSGFSATKILRYEGPQNSCPTRTGIYKMQLRHVDGVVAVWAGKDRELIDLALESQIPLYVHYHTKDYVVGLRFWEDDF